MDLAECAESEVDFFSEDPQEKKLAKSICMDCPVRWECLQTALDRKERWGIWGGADEVELRKDQAINAYGEPHVSSQGKVRCPFCGPLSTKNLVVTDRKRNKTKVTCSVCNLEWTIMKKISIKENNW